MATTRNDRVIVQQAIAEHLTARGGTGWDAVRARFPDVPVATFWRWVRAARKSPSPEQLSAARTLLANTPGAAMDATAPLPAPVPAAALIEGGIDSFGKFNFMRELDRLMADGELLRSLSLSADRTGVRNPKVFTDSAKLRIELMRLWLSAYPTLYSAERTQELYAAVIDAVAECDPEAAKRIVAKMRTVSERLGFVIAQ